MFIATFALLGTLLASVPAAAEIEPEVASSPAVADVWAGAANWTALTVELSDNGPEVEVLVEFAKVELALGSHEALARSDWIGIHNHSRRPTNTSDERFIETNDSMMWVSTDPSPDLHLSISVGWTYNSTLHARLWVCFKNNTIPVVICHSTSTVLSIHARLEWPQEPKLWSDEFGNYTNGSWVNQQTVVHIEAHWPVYEGTSEHAPFDDGIWEMRIDNGEVNQTYARRYVLSANITFRPGQGSRPRAFSLTPVHYVGPDDPRRQLDRRWDILVDTDPPYAQSVWPPTGEPALFGSPNATIGMVACDDESGIALGPEAATIEEASGAVPGNISGVVDLRDQGSPCVEILFNLVPPPGLTNWTITLRDAVGNEGRIENILVRRLPDDILYSIFSPTGPLPVLSFHASVGAKAPSGALLNLSSVQWSVTDGPGDARIWASAGLSGTAAESLLGADVLLPRSEVYYIQWRASLEGITELILSPLYTVTGDTEPPFARDLVCGVPVDGASEVSVVVGDNVTLVNWDDVAASVVDGAGNTDVYAATGITPAGALSANATFRATLGEGTNTITVVAHDLVGNALTGTTCQVQGPPPAASDAPRPTTQGADTDALPFLVLTAIVAAAAAAYFVFRAGRERGRD